MLQTHLQGDELVVDNRVLRQEVRPNRRLVLVGKTLVDILVHERRLPDPDETQSKTTSVLVRRLLLLLL